MDQDDDRFWQEDAPQEDAARRLDTCVHIVLFVSQVLCCSIYYSYYCYYIISYHTISYYTILILCYVRLTTFGTVTAAITIHHDGSSSSSADQGATHSQTPTPVTIGNTF